MEVIFGLITSIAFATDFYCIRKGLTESPDPVIATFITLTINFFFFVILSFFFVPSGLFKLNLVYLFIIAGILAPGCARAFNYKGIETLGISISVPIVNAEPLFSIFLALIFLNETLNFLLAIGIVSVISGLVLLGHGSGRTRKESTSRQFKYRYLFYPFLASMLYGVSVFIRKLGLNIVNSPIIGATFTSGTSWFIVFIFLLAGGNAKKIFHIKKRSLSYFMMAGVASCIAWISYFYGLSIGKVVIVAPLANCSSLFNLIFSYLLLRDIEVINSKIVIATILVVEGIIALSIGG